MAIVLINEIPTEVGSGADEILRLREELAAAQADVKRRIEAAWRDGYRSLSTYNDVDVSDEETCWKKSSTYDAIAKEKTE